MHTQILFKHSCFNLKVVLVLNTNLVFCLFFCFWFKLTEICEPLKYNVNKKHSECYLLTNG